MIDDAEYSNYYNEPAAEAKPAEPAFDPTQYVPREEYTQLQDQFQSIQPQLQTLQQLGSVFAPQQQQQPQLTPEQQALAQYVQSQVNTAIGPVTQQLEQYQTSQATDIVNSLGFNTLNEGDLWIRTVHEHFCNKAAAGDANANKLASQLEENYKKGALQTATFVRNSLPQIQQALSDNDYLKNSPCFKTVGVRQQTIGHSFGNNSFNSNQKPDVFAAIETARTSGNWAEVERLKSEMYKQ